MDEKHFIDPEDDFIFFAKGEVFERQDYEEGTERGIRGYASTEDVDKQKEVVLQRGLSFEPFIESGYFNDNHQRTTGSVVGYPTKAEFHKGKGWYVEGFLFKDHAPADHIWSLAKALAKGDAKRQLGFSIEGKTLERRGGCIVKAEVKHVAITHCPVNTSCTLETFSKSFCSHPEKSICIGCDPQCVNRVLAVVDTNGCNGNCVHKALTAGHQVSGQTGGSALRRESLEEDEKDLAYGEKNKKRRGKKVYGKSDVVVWGKSIGLSPDEINLVLAKLRESKQEGVRV